MSTVDLYLALLLCGIAFFLLYYIAQVRIAQLLRDRHPQQWRIIAVPEQGSAHALRIWLRLLQVLRTSQPRLPELLRDAAITRWYWLWRIAPWLAWLAWFGALYLQWRAH